MGHNGGCTAWIWIGIGAATERVMHADDDARAERADVQHHQAEIASEINDEA